MEVMQRKRSASWRDYLPLARSRRGMQPACGFKMISPVFFVSDWSSNFELYSGCVMVYYSVWLILVVDTYIPILLVRSSWALELNYSPDNPFRLRVSNAKSKQRQETLVFLTLYVETSRRCDSFLKHYIVIQQCPMFHSFFRNMRPCFTWLHAYFTSWTIQSSRFPGFSVLQYFPKNYASDPSSKLT